MGCEASGTNLLSLVLDAHSRLAVCRGSHYYLLFAPERRYYGDLTRPANLRRLVEDFRETLPGHGLAAPPAADLLGAIATPTFEGVLAAFLAHYARREGKARAGERSARHYLFLDDVLRGFPDSPVLYTMRDPRDVALAHRQGFGFDLAAAAGSWNAAYRRLRDAARPVHVVSYERLVQASTETVADACAALGEAYEPAMLRFHERTPEGFRGLAHHQKLFGPLDPAGVGSFRQLAEREIREVEARCAEGMAAMGYEPVSPASPAPPAAAGPERVRPGGARFLLNRLRYYGTDRARWARGVRRWKIVLRARLRYYARLEFLRQ